MSAEEIDSNVVDIQESEPATETAPEQPKVNAVVVHRIKKDNGDIQCIAEPVGDVQITEVDTILALGRKEFRSRIGLDE